MDYEKTHRARVFGLIISLLIGRCARYRGPRIPGCPTAPCRSVVRWWRCGQSVAVAGAAAYAIPAEIHILKFVAKGHAGT